MVCDRPVSKSQKHGCEWLNNSLNKARQLRKRWKNRITLENLALAERYLKAEIQIHVHIMVYQGSGKAAEYCAIFERCSGNQHFGSQWRQPDNCGLCLYDDPIV